MITLKDLQNLEREDIVTYIQESDRVDPELKVGDIFKYVFGNGMYVKLEKIGCGTLPKNGIYYVPHDRFLLYFDRKTIVRNEIINNILEQKEKD